MPDRFLGDDTAQDLVEYALLGAFVALAAMVVLTPVAPSVNLVFSKIVSLLVKFG